MDKEIKIINNFNKNGYIVEKIFSENSIEKFKKKILKNLKISAKKKSINSLNKLRNIEKYFDHISYDDHEIIIDRKTRSIKIDSKEVKKIFNKKISAVLSYFSDSKYSILRSTDVYFRKNKDIKNYAGFRIVKPFSKKVAGFHSENTYLKFRFTIWVPLVGFKKKYSLKIIPASHKIKHKKKWIYKNKIGVAKLYKEEYIKKFSKPVRLNLKLGEAILFHPYLIHGNSTNLGKNLRLSMEIRICNN